MKVAVSGRIQTGSYTHKEAGIKINTYDIIVEEQEFAESKRDQEAPSTSNEGWMNVPDGIDSDLPF